MKKRSRMAKLEGRIKVTKAMLRGSCMMAPDWVSNGRWALHKDRIANAAVFKSLDTVRAVFGELFRTHQYETDKEIIEKLLPTEERKDYLVQYDATMWAMGGHAFSREVQRRLFVTATGRMAFLDDEYIQALKIDRLWAESERGVFMNNAEPELVTACLMPMRTDEAAWPNEVLYQKMQRNHLLAEGEDPVWPTTELYN